MLCEMRDASQHDKDSARDSTSVISTWANPEPKGSHPKSDETAACTLERRCLLAVDLHRDLHCRRPRDLALRCVNYPRCSILEPHVLDNRPKTVNLGVGARSPGYPKKHAAQVISLRRPRFPSSTLLL